MNSKQLTRWLIGALCAVLAACGGGGGGKSTNGGVSKVAQLSSPSGQFFDVGDALISTTISQTLTIENSGSVTAANLAISLTSTQFDVIGGDCRTLDSLVVGAACTLQIEFHAPTLGSYSDTLTIAYYDGKAAQSLAIELRANAGEPGLVFALMDSGDDTAEFNRYLQMDNVDGIAVRLSWLQLQSQEPNLTWTKINHAFSAAKAAGKKVTLHILSSVYGDAPFWLQAATYTYNLPSGAVKTDPVPWDSVYLAKWTTFLHSLSVHLEANNYLADLEYISIASPVPEMSLVACSNNDLNGSGAGSVTYSRQNYLNAWKDFALAMDNELLDVKKLLPVPVSHICYPDNDGALFYQDLFDYLQQNATGPFTHYATDLSATGSDRLVQTSGVLADADIALQYKSAYTESVTNGVQLGGSLMTATCDHGVRNYGAVYFEVYKEDLDNNDAAVQEAIDAIHAPWTCP